MHGPFIIFGAISIMFLACIPAKAPEDQSGSPDASLVDERMQVSKNWQSVGDLVAQSSDAFFTRGGIHLGPGLPGWRSISGYDRAQIWGGEKEITDSTGSTRYGSWLGAIGATLRFPNIYAMEKSKLRFWFYSPAKQAVSLFLNEKSLGTVNIQQGWREYVLNVGALKVGDHRLRFWFRHNFSVDRVKTPGALGTFTLTDENVSAMQRSDLYRDGGLVGLDGAQWTFYVLASPGERLRGVFEGSAKTGRVKILIQTDEKEPVVIHTHEFQAKERHEFDIPLPIQQTAAFRITLMSESPSDQFTGVWASVQRFRDRSVPEVHTQEYVHFKRLVFVLLDRTEPQDLRLGRSGVYPNTPTLDRLSAEGITLHQVFTGHDTLSSRLETLMKWANHATRSTGARYRASVFSQSALNLTDAFASRLDREWSNTQMSTSELLGEFHRWVQLGGDSPFITTIVLKPPAAVAQERRSTLQSRGPFSQAKTFTRQAVARSQKITALDQSIAQLTGFLDFAFGDEQTLLFVMPYRLNRKKALKDMTPYDYFAPLVLWSTNQEELTTRRVAHTSEPLDKLMTKVEVSNGADGHCRLGIPMVWGTERLSTSSTSSQTGFSAIAESEWLLLIQDARSYGLWRFDAGWTPASGNSAITQRAIRTLYRPNE